MWLSRLALECIEVLHHALPDARFVRVGPSPQAAGRDDCLDLLTARLESDPQGELTRLFNFLGESGPTAPVQLRPCG